jgi:hypothetical protein
MADLLAAIAPDVVVIAGSHARDDEVARWAYAVRSAAGPLPVTLFRRNLRSARVRTTGARALPSPPSEAQRDLLELVEGGRLPAVRPRRDPQTSPVDPPLPAESG